MELYSYFRSSCSYRVRIVLNLKKIPYKTSPIHLINDGGEQNKSDYLQINPLGQVPFLKFDDRHGVAQSTAIVEYLDEVYPDPPLMPEKPFDRAQVRQLVQMINAGIQPLQNLSLLQKLKQNFGATESQIKKWNQDWISKGFEALEIILKKTAGKYCFGNQQVTLADTFLIPQVYNANRYEVDLVAFPTIQKINNNCLEMDAFQKAIPENQPDAPKK